MKVLLIDDHPLILAALETVVKGLGEDVSVLGLHSAAAARATLAHDADFDFVLLDLQLGDADGFDLLAELRAAYPALPVVVVSASASPANVIRAIDLGAMGFVPKRASHDMLHEALRMVMYGGIYVPPMTAGAGGDASDTYVDEETVPGYMKLSGPQTATGELNAPHSLAALGLTPRQTEVLSLLLQGQPNKLIARQLNVAVETVKDHVGAVMRALGVSSRTQAVLAVARMAQPGPGDAPHPGGR